jgi:hypothetical protein
MKAITRRLHPQLDLASQRLARPDSGSTGAQFWKPADSYLKIASEIACTQTEGSVPSTAQPGRNHRRKCG